MSKIKLTDSHIVDESEILEMRKGAQMITSDRKAYYARLKTKRLVDNQNEIVSSGAPFLRLTDVADGGTHELVSVWLDQGKLKHCRSAVLWWQHEVPVFNDCADAGRSLPFTAAPGQPDLWFYRNLASGECYSDTHCALGTDLDAVLKDYAKKAETLEKQRQLAAKNKPGTVDAQDRLAELAAGQMVRNAMVG